MRRNILAIGFALSLLGNILFVVQAYERSRVISVPDGDSLDLADGRRIRLLGIDAPEKGRCQAQEARSKLVELAQGRRIRLKEVVKDDFGRQLAIVIVEDFPTWFRYLRHRISSDSWDSSDSLDPFLQRGLVAAGLARNESSRSNPYHRVLTEAQEVAKTAKLGIWSDACRGSASGRSGCTIKGNVREGRKQFYTPDCPYYPDVLVDTSFGDAWFCSEAEATNAGFTQAASCK